MPNHLARPADTALTVSGYVRETAASVRRPADVMARRREARIAPYLNSDLYLILVERSHGETYAPEVQWPAMVSKRMALDHLAQNATMGDVVVISVPADGKRLDVSKQFATDLAIRLADEGHGADFIVNFPFVGTHLTNQDVDAICGGWAA